MHNALVMARCAMLVKLTTTDCRYHTPVLEPKWVSALVIRFHTGTAHGSRSAQAASLAQSQLAQRQLEPQVRFALRFRVQGCFWLSHPSPQGGALSRYGIPIPPRKTCTISPCRHHFNTPKAWGSHLPLFICPSASIRLDARALCTL